MVMSSFKICSDAKRKSIWPSIWPPSVRSSAMHCWLTGSLSQLLNRNSDGEPSRRISATSVHQEWHRHFQGYTMHLAQAGACHPTLLEEHHTGRGHTFPGPQRIF